MSRGQAIRRPASWKARDRFAPPANSSRKLVRLDCWPRGAVDEDPEEHRIRGPLRARGGAEELDDPAWGP
eukprot:3116106-Pyramimonas_sp.AAC.1